MRGIKFRAWDDHEKVFFYNFIKNNIIQVRSDRERHNVIMLGNIQVLIDQGCKLEQFTGLRDKNGKEIYEGDILYTKNRYGDGLAVVKNSGWSFYVEPISQNADFVWADQDGNNWECSNTEVIGNIHENPEL